MLNLAYGPRPPSGHAQITPRERQLLRCLLSEGSVRKAAAKLEMNESTARVHMRQLDKKTETHTVAKLLVWSLAHRPCCVLDRAERDSNG